MFLFGYLNYLGCLFAATVVAGALMLGGCGGDDPPARDPAPMPIATPPDTIFHLPNFPAGRQLDTTFALDLDGDHQPEQIVTSLADRAMIPNGARADLIQVFRQDPKTRHWAQAMSDSAFWMMTLSTLDATGDRHPDIVAELYSGGNDDVAARGMLICSGDSGPVRLILRADRGAPKFAPPLPHVQGKGVLMHDLLWPVFTSHAAARSYVSDVLAFADGAFRSMNNRQAGFYLEAAQQQLEEYRTARKDLQGDTITVEEDVRLFAPAALALLALERANGARAMRSFWDSESEFLRQRLPGVQFQELDSIYAAGVERLR
ncbi:MAG: hypothetical protein K1X90_05625 [Candidatus Kapabacteria bacterium]|nr:hypothetical protein [Candidatus Kapabacteria bacterium]